VYCSDIWLDELFRIIHWDEEKWSCTYSPQMSKFYIKIKLPETKDNLVTWESVWESPLVTPI